jgi:hypothetical protein
MINVRLIKHEALLKCGSYEVHYSDGRPSLFFYFDDLPSRRLDPATLTSEEALEKAKGAAKYARDISPEVGTKEAPSDSTSCLRTKPPDCRRKPEREVGGLGTSGHLVRGRLSESRSLGHTPLRA